MPAREDVYQKAMNEGHSAAWDQDWKIAASAYRKALQEFPDQPKALNSLGLALYQLGQFDEALGIYQHVAKLSPDDPVAFEKVAQISERVGDLNAAVDASLNAAELFLNQREVDKAVENWVRVTTLNPEHVMAHSRLALVHERLNQKSQPVTEYLAIASILQRPTKPDKAQEIVTKALQLMPESAEAKQAQAILRATASGLDPVAEARQKALTKLAEVLFDYSDDSAGAQERRGLSAIVKGTGALSLQQSDQTKVVFHLGQAIDAQTRNQDAQAAEELEHALEAGFNHPAIYFDLGSLRAKADRLESAVRNLTRSVKHNDYALGSRLLLGEIHFKKGQIKEASLEYLEALKLADSNTVSDEEADEIRQMYEPLIEGQQNQNDDTTNRRLCDSISKLLMRPDWRDQVHRTREELHKNREGTAPTPLAEMVLQAGSSGVIESINRIHQLARIGSLRSAMDEAYDAVQHAPTYLPLHTLIGDLLIQDGRGPDAIAKFTVVAHAYGVRGEPIQATKLLRRVIELAPMDLPARTRLIDQLVIIGQIDKAIKEYLELAELYYRLAELDLARKTYTTALRLVQQANADRAWNVHILQRMADIDMQRLDWKQALRVYEQIRTLRPDDEVAHKQLIELYMRMGQEPQALAELESYLSYLDNNGKNIQSIPFLEDLVKEHEDQLLFHRVLAEQLIHLGRKDDAISHLDALGESLLQNGKKKEAVTVINQILLINPPNAEDYRQLLAQIG